MKVMVTGSAGFIGSHLARVLTARGHEIICFDRPHYDVCDRETVFRIASQAEAVVNLAGLLGTGELLRREDLAVQANITGALNVYDAAMACQIPCVQIATGHRGQLNTYAITKACAEDMALARAQWDGHKIAVVRAYHVYGPRQKPAFPYGPGTVRKIFPAFACAALKGDPLEVFGSGSQLIDLVRADEVAIVLADAINGPYGEIIDAGTGVATTVLKAAQDVLAIAGSPAEITFVPMRKGEPETSVVVAQNPRCPTPWPWKAAEALDWYRSYLKARP